MEVNGNYNSQFDNDLKLSDSSYMNEYRFWKEQIAKSISSEDSSFNDFDNMTILKGNSKNFRSTYDHAKKFRDKSSVKLNSILMGKVSLYQSSIIDEKINYNQGFSQLYSNKKDSNKKDTIVKQAANVFIPSKVKHSRFLVLKDLSGFRIWTSFNYTSSKDKVELSRVFEALGKKLFKLVVRGKEI